MPRRNRPKGAKQPQNSRLDNWITPDLVPQHRKLLPHVPTTGTCSLKGRRYGTPEDAAEALRRAIINREILQSPVVEDRWYPQPGDAPCVCQGYHLTSSPRRAR